MGTHIVFKFSVLKAAVNNFILWGFFSVVCPDFFVLNNAGHRFFVAHLQFFYIGLAANKMIQYICVLGVTSTKSKQHPTG